jgi:adenosylcobinamide kinase/adenosylcobinamide-phosphate guanylyltransferase
VSTPSSHVTLLLGGARSGKSATAERIAAASDLPVLYVATAQGGDEEMQARIARHRSRRPAHWRTLDAPFDLPALLADAAPPDHLILVDAVDVWLANELLRLLASVTDGEIPRALAADVESRLLGAVADIASCAAGRQTPVLLVSSEVGSGVVPPYPLGRLFRDVLGAANQALAAAANRVLLVVAGIPVDLRALAWTMQE